MLRLRSYAKINLYLDVLGKRPDGYHDLETIFQSVDLFDEIELDLAEGDVLLTCEHQGVPQGEDNLVVRAARLLQRETGHRGGARIHLHKRIPIGAGLAGGSGNAAAALVGLNILWDLRVSPAQLLELGLELGSDVPFCLTGGTQAATGRGEVLEALTPIENVWFALVHPPIHVSTASVFNDPAITCSNERPESGKTPSFQRAIEYVRRGEWAGAVFNRLGPIVFTRHPELAEAKSRLIASGCIAAVMSGTGPTLVGVFSKRRHADDARVLQLFESSVASPVTRGIEIVQA
ncbi:MAG: 4-(cytidine 5'-diphospho)-2-C-methyl-D-erythritol kinase [Candidatus Hydrogenedentota bacterium]